jgi:hypothetical protein
MSYVVDRQQGIEAEDEVLDIIQNKFKDNISKVDERYCKYDFEGDKYIYELKMRNNFYSSFPTTMIPQDKILDSDKRQVFLFKFKDGLYYIKHRKKIFKDFEVKPFKRFRSDYNDKEKLYIYIPIEKLKQINF